MRQLLLLGLNRLSWYISNLVQFTSITGNSLRSVKLCLDEFTSDCQIQGRVT